MQSGATSAQNSLRQADEATVAYEIEDEFKLPKRASLVIVIFSNVLLQVRDSSFRACLPRP